MNYGYIILAYLSLIALSFVDNGRSASYSYILSDFSIETSYGSLIFTLASVTALVSNLTAKWWLDWLGLISSTRLALFLLSVSSYFFYMNAEVKFFPGFLASSALAGLGLGILTVTMNVMVSEGSLDNKRRKFLSGLHGVYGLSSLLAPLAINQLVSSGYEWFSFFILIGILSLLSLLYSLFVLDSHKSEMKKGNMVNASLKTKLLVGFFLGFYVTGEILISSRLSFYINSYHNFGVDKSNQYLSMFFFFLMLGRLSFAFINTKIKSDKLMLCSLVLSLTFFIIGYAGYPLFLSLTGLSMSIFFPLTIDWIKEEFKSESTSIIAFSMTAIGVMLSASHWGVGILSKLYSIRTSFILYFLYIGLSLVFLVKMRRIKN